MNIQINKSPLHIFEEGLLLFLYIIPGVKYKVQSSKYKV